MTRLDRIVHDVAAGETLTEGEVAALVRLAVADAALQLANNESFKFSQGGTYIGSDPRWEPAHNIAVAAQREKAAALAALMQEET